VIVAWVGSRFVFAGKGERGIALTRRAMALDSHQMPTGVYDSFAAYHFQRKEYAEALAAAQKSRVPGSIWSKIYGAASYGQLGRQAEARPTVEELLSLIPASRSRPPSRSCGNGTSRMRWSGAMWRGSARRACPRNPETETGALSERTHRR